jgi:hypothetical protein
VPANAKHVSLGMSLSAAHAQPISRCSGSEICCNTRANHHFDHDIDPTNKNKSDLSERQMPTSRTVGLVLFAVLCWQPWICSTTSLMGKHTHWRSFQPV